MFAEYKIKLVGKGKAELSHNSLDATGQWGPNWLLASRQFVHWGDVCLPSSPLAVGFLNSTNTQVANQLFSRDLMDPVPVLIHFYICGSTENRTCDVVVSSQTCWPPGQRGGLNSFQLFFTIAYITIYVRIFPYLNLLNTAIGLTRWRWSIIKKNGVCLRPHGKSENLIIFICRWFDFLHPNVQYYYLFIF